MPAREALGAVSQIIEAYLAGRRVRQSQEELKVRKDEAEAQRKQREEEFKQEQGLRQSQFDFQKAQAEINKIMGAKGFTEEAEKTGNIPPGYTISEKPEGAESIQLAPGLAGTRLTYEPTGFEPEIQKYLPSFQARDPRTAAVQEAERLRQVGEPALEAKQTLEEQKQKGRLAIEAAEAQVKMDLANKNNLARYNQAVEVQRLRNQGAYDVALLRQRQKDIESGKIKLTSTQQEKRNALLEMQKVLGEAKQLLEIDKYSFYQGPLAGIDDQLKSFKGEDNPTWADISTKLSLLRQIYSLASAGKSFTQTEERLLAGHIPSPDHMMKASQIASMIGTLEKLIPSMIQDIYAGSKGIEITETTTSESPVNPATPTTPRTGGGRRPLGEIFR